MIKYTPQNQFTIDMVETHFKSVLDKDNRWVKLAKFILWDNLAEIYCQKLNSKSWRRSVDVRLVIAALIVKHELSPDDRGTVAMIQENMYIQYICG